MTVKKRLILTVTSGRSGTAYLSHLLSGLPGIRSEHEPAPHFHDHLPEARRDPALARQFLAEQKIPFIEAIPEATYIESSHYAGKGFIEPMLEMGVVPDLILLSRDARKVASSFYLIGTAKKRLFNRGKGRRHMIFPDEPNFLPAQGWKRWHEYQLYYWYVLETEARARHYARLVGSRGGNSIHVTLERLIDGRDAEALLTWAGVSEEAAKARVGDHEFLRRVVNDKSQSKRRKGRDRALAALDLAALEAGVRMACNLAEKAA